MSMCTTSCARHRNDTSVELSESSLLLLPVSSSHSEIVASHKHFQVAGGTEVK